MNSKSSEEGLIYEVQITPENITNKLTCEIYRLQARYGPRIEDRLYAFALGPNAFKCYELWARTVQRFNCERLKMGECENAFMGVRILCSPIPYIVPIFDAEGWHYAHMEAKRVTDLTSRLDS